MSLGNLRGISQTVSKEENIVGMPPALTEEYGTKILDVYKHACARTDKVSQFRSWMEGYLKGYLQGRLTEKEAKHLETVFTPSHRRTFESIIRVAKEQSFEKRGGYKLKPGFGDNYTEINDPNHPSKLGTKMRIQDGREVVVTYKEYFTFTPTTQDPGEILIEANRFYTALFLAYQKLQKMGSLNGAGVAMKFKDNLDGLMRDLDSVVFYVDNPQAGKLVRQVVDGELKAAKLRTDRVGRAGTGFDLEFPNGDAFSHRQLISKAVAKVIDEDYRGKRVILNKTPKWLGESIEQRCNQAGKLTPEQMVQAIA